jgi:hypothetical protein
LIFAVLRLINELRRASAKIVLKQVERLDGNVERDESIRGLGCQ